MMNFKIKEGNKSRIICINEKLREGKTKNAQRKTYMAKKAFWILVIRRLIDLLQFFKIIIFFWNALSYFEYVII